MESASTFSRKSTATNATVTQNPDRCRAGNVTPEETPAMVMKQLDISVDFVCSMIDLCLAALRERSRLRRTSITPASIEVDT